MRKKALILLFFSSNLVAQEFTRPESTEMSSQHTVVISLSALFRCGLDRWPESLSELKEFQEINDIKLGIESNWPWLLSSDFRYEAKKKMSLTSESPDGKGNVVKINSGQNKPSCTKKGTDMRGAYLDVDFGEKSK